MVYEDDLYIGPDTNIDALKLDALDDLYITGGSLILPASEYVNFGGTQGVGGYGLRDNAGDVEYCDSGGAWTALNTIGGGAGAPTDAQYVCLAVNAGLSAERVLTGTANQITITDNGANGTVVLSTPQDIHTGAGPTFDHLHVDSIVEPAASGTPFLAGYGFRKKITVQTANLDAAQTGFKLYVPISADADIGGECLSNGYDVRFTSSDGETEIPFERVSFAVAAGAATGIFWVLSDLATSPATDIYVYYGNAAAADASAPTSVWAGTCKGAYHFSESYGTGADNYKDSSAGAHHGTLTDADADSAQGTGKVGKCVDLNGDADYLAVADHADHDPGGAMTAEIWVNVPARGDWASVMGHASDQDPPYWALMQQPTTPTARFAFRGQCTSGSFEADGSTDVAGAMAHVAITFDKTLGSARAKVYVNGALDGSANAYAEDLKAGGRGIEFGYWNAGGGRYLDGLIDEARYYTDAKAASWIKFEYANINEADHELTWAAEEIGSYVLAIGGDVNITGAYQVSGNQVIGTRVVDARIDDAINTSAWDSTTAGVLDALRDAAIAHGWIAAA